MSRRHDGAGRLPCSESRSLCAPRQPRCRCAWVARPPSGPPSRQPVVPWPSPRPTSCRRPRRSRPTRPSPRPSRAGCGRRRESAEELSSEAASLITALGFVDDREVVQVVNTQLGTRETSHAGDDRRDDRQRPQALDLQHHRHAARLPIPGLGVEAMLPPGEETMVALPPLSAPQIYEIECHLHPPHRHATLVVRARRARQPIPTDRNPSSCSTSGGLPKTRPPLPARAAQRCAARRRPRAPAAASPPCPRDSGTDRPSRRRRRRAPARGRRRRCSRAAAGSRAPCARRPARSPKRSKRDRIAVRHDRAAQVRLLRHAHGLAVAPAAAAAPAEVALAERRQVDQADQRLVAVDERDQRRRRAGCRARRRSCRRSDRPASADPRGCPPRRTPRPRSRSPGWPRAGAPRIARSAARSASVTGEPSALLLDGDGAEARQDLARAQVGRPARGERGGARDRVSACGAQGRDLRRASPRRRTRDGAMASTLAERLGFGATTASRSCTATTSECVTPRTTAASRRCGAGRRPAAA